MPKVAIVGTGVAGLGCAWQLRDCANLVLLEKQPRPGGHTNTVTVDEDGSEVPIDTGFIVFNKATYPNLLKLFTELEVAIQPSEMSFSVQHVPSGLEYNGMGFSKVFAQRRNLVNLRFLRLLREIFRFFKLAPLCLNKSDLQDLTVGQFAGRFRFSDDFLRFYLVPMSSAVWSTDPRRMLDFPAANLIRFFNNHGFLGVSTHHQWFTVTGGARTYVDRILAKTGAARLGTAAEKIVEAHNGVRIFTSSGEQIDADLAVVATHADEALKLLASPSPIQGRLLGRFPYQSNHATLHTDSSWMPKRRVAWASWNYRLESDSAPPTTHYWMNALQSVSKRRDYFVSLNCEGRIAADQILYETTYEHPVYTLEGIKAQRELPLLNEPAGNSRVFFCGSYFRYGFHEDAYASAVDCSRAIRQRLRTL